MLVFSISHQGDNTSGNIETLTSYRMTWVTQMQRPQLDPHSQRSSTNCKVLKSKRCNFSLRKNSFKIEARIPTKFKILLQHEKDKELSFFASNNHPSRLEFSFILSFQLPCQSTLHHKCTLVPFTHWFPMSFPFENSLKSIDVPLFSAITNFIEGLVHLNYVLDGQDDMGWIVIFTTFAKQYT